MIPLTTPRPSSRPITARSGFAVTNPRAEILPSTWAYHWRNSETPPQRTTHHWLLVRVESSRNGWRVLETPRRPGTHGGWGVGAAAVPSGVLEGQCAIMTSLWSGQLCRQASVKLAEQKARAGGPPGARLQPPQPGPLLAWYPWCPALLPAAWCNPAAIRTALPGSVVVKVVTIVTTSLIFHLILL